ncbi:hypothetical protein M885DRAFT_529858 [Pelagophyceae sp. CCMP2097]|nr:hypothetical protein M885DRAFT_529858 [Pelagophyceae sp. CCMP2097]
MAELGDCVRLRCGVVLPNRIVKAATSEHLGHPRSNDPTAELYNLYQTWSESGCGTIITGNIMVDRRRLEAPRNVVIDSYTDLRALEAWAARAHGRGVGASSGAPAIVVLVQLGHPGRQSPVSVSWARPVAPSSVGLALAGVGVQLHRSPRELEKDEVEDVISRFAASAKLVCEAGFEGVQVHGAHGYLLSSFLSKATNHRKDAFGGTSSKRREMLLRVCRACRAAIGPSKVLSVKINATDFGEPGDSFEPHDCAEVLEALAHDACAVDFVEVTGGTYANGMACLGDVADFAEGAPRREGLFVPLAMQLRRALRSGGHGDAQNGDIGVRLMVTGGFMTRNGASTAICEGDDAPDLVGVARLLCVDAEAVRAWVAKGEGGAPPPEKAGHAPAAPRRLVRLRRTLIPGLNYGWHTRQLKRLSRGLAPKMDMSHFPFVFFDLPRALLFEPARVPPAKWLALAAAAAAVAAAWAAA